MKLQLSYHSAEIPLLFGVHLLVTDFKSWHRIVAIHHESQTLNAVHQPVPSSTTAVARKQQFSPEVSLPLLGLGFRDLPRDVEG